MFPLQAMCCTMPQFIILPMVRIIMISRRTSRKAASWTGPLSMLMAMATLGKGVVTGSAMHFDDHDTSAETCYYQVTAINTIVGGECESAPAMAADGIHDYVTVHTDGMNEQDAGAIAGGIILINAISGRLHKRHRKEVRLS